MKITQNYKNIDSCIEIDTWIKWPTVSIFSWVHWDEISWIYATNIFLDKLEKWEIKVNCWKINLVLEANEVAVKDKKREVCYNLNRLFKDDIVYWDTYEEKRAIDLKKILRESEYHLDLHSTSGPSIPFLFSEMSNFQLAKKLWISHIVWWWWELDEWVISWDTELYVNKLWWTWFTFEAWNHDNPEWWKNSYQMILNFLSSLDLIDKKYFKEIWKEEVYFKVIDSYIAKTDNFRYSIEIENFKKLKKWTLIWKDWDEEIIAKDNMILTMPKTNYKKWWEVFFIWKEIK